MAPIRTANGASSMEERPPVTPIRTASEMDASIIIPPLLQIPVYRKIAQKGAELRDLNMTYAAIAKSLNVSKQLAMIAFRYYREG
ncbi:MAG: hypothetical protein A2351_08655 [Omnitrophica bacterium RIFOXYB12_FULL_50_7]|nr:MAG: hypothetical protein A2351_08655 [Omnitrophica bacterium RIFOXYB12_FULL_50_7]